MTQSASIRPFHTLGRGDIDLVGGKGANLGEMTQAGFPIPPGFCVTTGAYWDFMKNASPGLIDDLDAILPGDLPGVRRVAAKLRAHLCLLPMSEALEAAALTAYRALGEGACVAVRSSATAEDLPDASFAGQQDTYLNVVGKAALLEAITRCWASLFTDRAIVYRLENGFAHREVALSVVVQRMVFPDVSGIAFTADPVTGHRGRTLIEASYGLGEALVSGVVTPDKFVVDSPRLTLLERQVSEKKQGIFPRTGGGTETRPIEEHLRHKTCISDETVMDLARVFLRVAAHYGTPQDLEWAVEKGEIFLLQARPITSLFPIPSPVPGEPLPRAYISFHHMQVMMDPMPTLARSLWTHIFPFGRSGDPDEPFAWFREAGGRLFIDFTPILSSPILGRAASKALAMTSDGISQRLLLLGERDDFQGVAASGGAVSSWTVLGQILPVITHGIWIFIKGGKGLGGVAGHRLIDSKIQIVERELLELSQGAPRLRHLTQALTGRLVPWLMTVFPPRIFPAIAGSRLLAKVFEDDPEALADLEAITRGLDGNVTTEMDLRVGDLADGLRLEPDLIQALDEHVHGQRPLESLSEKPGGDDFLRELARFLDDFGMRGPSEIDVSRKRWRDDATSLLKMVLGNVNQVGGAHRLRHQQYSKEAMLAVERLKLAGKKKGIIKGLINQRLLPLVRNGLALREHPKFLLICYMAMYRREMLAGGALLVSKGILNGEEDVWHLSLPELLGALETEEGPSLKSLVEGRKIDFTKTWRLKAPPVMTSEGETPRRPPPKDLPEGALAGTPASSGVVEGVARVLMDPTKDILEHGEILVAPFTDPGWTPLFLNAKALVMEVGGMMTHGSVVAREYGIPAVVGVEGACTQIKTGDVIRVDGERGLVFCLNVDEINGEKV